MWCFEIAGNNSYDLIVFWNLRLYFEVSNFYSQEFLCLFGKHIDNDIISVFVKLQTPTTIPVHVTPCLGSFENRGSYIKFLGQELLSGPAV